MYPKNYTSTPAIVSKPSNHLSTVSGQEEEFQCPERSGYFPDPYQCDLYYSCSQGKPYLVWIVICIRDSFIMLFSLALQGRLKPSCVPMDWFSQTRARPTNIVTFPRTWNAETELNCVSVKAYKFTMVLWNLCIISLLGFAFQRSPNRPKDARGLTDSSDTAMSR